jgi:hypothetical protein
MLRGMTYFAVLAPPLGGVMLGLGIAFLDTNSKFEVISLIQVALTFAIFSYMYGGIAAGLTGAFAEIILRRFKSLVGDLIIGILGFSFSVLFQYNNSSNLSDPQFFLMFGAPAFFSGIVISMFFRRRLNRTNYSQSFDNTRRAERE